MKPNSKQSANITANREEDARKMAIEGAGYICARLAQMRDVYAADKRIGRIKAELWLTEVTVFLNENGILVIPNCSMEVAKTKFSGDTQRAFAVFEAWVLAISGVIPWDESLKIATQKAPQPMDVFLMIAIANAFGKSERWLNATTEMLEQKRSIAKLPRGKGKAVTPEAVAAFANAAGPVTQESLVAKAAEYFDVSPRTIARRLKEAKNKLSA